MTSELNVKANYLYVESEAYYDSNQGDDGA